MAYRPSLWPIELWLSNNPCPGTLGRVGWEGIPFWGAGRHHHKYLDVSPLSRDPSLPAFVLRVRAGDRTQEGHCKVQGVLLSLKRLQCMEKWASMRRNQMHNHFSPSIDTAE